MIIFSERRGPRSFSSAIVTLNRLGDDGAGGVAFLVILTLRRDGPCHVAGLESQGNRQACQHRRQGRRDNLVNLLLVHVFSFR